MRTASLDPSRSRVNSRPWSDQSGWLSEPSSPSVTGRQVPPVRRDHPQGGGAVALDVTHHDDAAVAGPGRCSEQAVLLHQPDQAPLRGRRRPGRRGLPSASTQTTARDPPSGLKAGRVVNGHSWLASSSRSRASSVPSTRASRGSPPIDVPGDEVGHPLAILGDRREGRRQDRRRPCAVCTVSVSRATMPGAELRSPRPEPGSPQPAGPAPSRRGRRSRPRRSTPTRRAHRRPARWQTPATTRTRGDAGVPPTLVHAGPTCPGPAPAPSVPLPGPSSSPPPAAAAVPTTALRRARLGPCRLRRPAGSGRALHRAWATPARRRGWPGPAVHRRRRAPSAPGPGPSGCRPGRPTGSAPGGRRATGRGASRSGCWSRPWTAPRRL